LINSAASKFPDGLFHVHLYVTNVEGAIDMEVDEKGKAIEYCQREESADRCVVRCFEILSRITG